MRRVFADTLYWVASLTPGDPWHAATRQAVASLGRFHVVTTEEVLDEFLTAYAGRGDFLRQQAAKAARGHGQRHGAGRPHRALWSGALNSPSSPGTARTSSANCR
jgi:hypothetical protein